MWKEFFSFRTRCVPRGGRNQTLKSILIVSAICLAFAQTARAQTTAFTYQGKLTDGGLPATAQYDFTFKLYDSASGGTQVGANVTVEDLQVTAGIFTVNLNYGAAPFTSVTGNYLEIAVRPGTSTGAYTTLSPRQPITSSPFSIKTVNASSADSLSAACVLCVTDGHITSIDGAKVTGTVNYANFAGNVAGVVGIENGGTGSSTKNFVDLSTDQIRIGGNKQFEGVVSVAGESGRFVGNGSGLTNLNGANLTDGSVTRAKLATDYRNGFNPQQVALLRWDLLPVQKNRFEVGRAPSALAFDGTFMYVANKVDNNVMRIRVSTGVVEGSPIAVGSAPGALVYDGTFMNVANSGSGTVTRIRTATGVVENSVAVGTNPVALAFDGTYVYAARSEDNGSVVRFQASSGTVVDTIAVGYRTNSLVFDGAYVYVANSIHPTTNVPGDVKRILPSTGAVETISGLTGNFGSLAFDGTFVYVGDFNEARRIRASTGVKEAFGVRTQVGNSNKPLVFDGTFLYLGGAPGPSSGILGIIRLNINGLGVDGSHIPVFGSKMTALAFDGTYVYAATEAIFTDPSTGIVTQVNGNVIRF